jgi:hypothetical protein
MLSWLMVKDFKLEKFVGTSLVRTETVHVNSVETQSYEQSESYKVCRLH